MKKILLFTISCAFFFTSCEDFLDVKPTHQADSKSAITTVNDAQVMMRGIMRNFITSAYYGRNMFLYADAKGGDLTIGSRGRGYDDLYVFNHSPSSNYSGFWSQIYFCLALINNLVISVDVLLDAGNQSPANTTTLQHVKAQALTARAMCYFDLVRIYGKPYDMDKNSLGVPLVLELVDASAQPTRATVEQVYSQVVSDLTTAAPLFVATQKNNGLINYYANIALQARVYLYMQNWSSALTAAETVIEKGGYTLYTNENWLSSWSKQYQSESIFELNISTTEGNLTTGSLGSMIVWNKSYPSVTSWSYYFASDSFLALLEADPTDVRLGLMALDEKSEDNAPPFQVVNRKGCCTKYLGGVSAPGDGKGNATAVNVKVIRLSEVYLIAAEAALKSNNPSKAADYLQAIRKRASNLEPATAANVTMKMIQDERSKELFGEGHRFFDMMRWNESITYSSDYWCQSPIITREETINRTFYKIIQPIDQAEITANPALKDQQNPGY